MPRKKKPANALKARARLVTKRTAKRTATRKVGARKKKVARPEPPRKLFDAKKWFGAFPELAGPTLKIQRQMRDEW